MAPSRSHRNRGGKLGLCLVPADSTGPNPTSAVAGTPGPAPLTRPRGPPSRHSCPHAFRRRWLSSLESRMPSSFIQSFFRHQGETWCLPKPLASLPLSTSSPCPHPLPRKPMTASDPHPHPSLGRWEPRARPSSCSPHLSWPWISPPLWDGEDSRHGARRGVGRTLLSPAWGAGDPGCPPEACPTPSRKGPPG